MADRLTVGGAPVERGWRDMLSNALDVFATPTTTAGSAASASANPNEHRAHSAAAAPVAQQQPRRSPGGGLAGAFSSATMGGRGPSSVNGTGGARRPSPLMTLLSRGRPDAHHLHLQEGGGGGGGGGGAPISSSSSFSGLSGMASPQPAAHWLLDSTRSDLDESPAPSPSLSRSASASVSAPSRRGGAGMGAGAGAGTRRHVEPPRAATRVNASSSPASSAESEAALNEAAARAAQARLIASVAGAYVRGQLIPVISAAAAVPSSSPATGAAAAAGGAGAEGAPSPITPAAAAEAQGEAVAFGAAAACGVCTRAGTSDGAVAAPAAAASCAWAEALALDQSSAGARATRLARLRELNWSTPLSSTHRASVWLSLTVGDDPLVHAHWERYYTCVLASAAATAPSPPAASPAPSHAGDASPSPSFPATAGVASVGGAPSSTPSRSRTKFSAVAFNELLKDVGRTHPTFRFFSDARHRGVHVLQRLLTAFSLHRPIVGYCQSLNTLAGLIALVFQGHPEHMAFAMLCHLLEPRLAYYGKSMLGCVLDSRVLRDLVSFHEPDLSAVLAKQDVSVEHFSSSWLLCLFIHAPLALQHALRVWDFYLSQGETILFHTGLALFHIHRNAFIHLYKPSAEQLMNIVLKQIGSGTSITELLARVRTSFESTPSMGASIEALRRFHRAALSRELSVLSSSKLRRLERSTGVDGAELQRLWTCFLQGEQRWSTLVSGVINDLVHFRIAFGEAVFPPSHQAGSTSGTLGGGGGAGNHQRQRPHSRLAAQQESPKLWQGSGIVQATLAAADAPPCRLCVPSLPPLFHMVDAETRPLQSCPRCTWLSDGAAVPASVAAALESTRPTPADPSAPAADVSPAFGVSAHPRCSCGCSCISRVSGLESSVFGRLFLLLDGRGGLHRGYLDFEDFVAGCALFTASNRAQRLRAVFRMALSASADARGDGAGHDAATATHAEGATTVPSSSPGGRLSSDHSSGGGVDDSHVVRGRVSRAGFISLVALFEELYHGRSYIAQPVSAPSTSAPGAPVQIDTSEPAHEPAPPAPVQIPASLPASWVPFPANKLGGTAAGVFASPTAPVVAVADAASCPPAAPTLLLSSQASSRFFVEAMFEKAAADRQRRAIQRWERGEDLAMAAALSAASFDLSGSGAAMAAATGSVALPEDLSPTGPNGELDSLSYESFAHCIVLHPLISNFFRLDDLAA